MAMRPTNVCRARLRERSWINKNNWLHQDTLTFISKFGYVEYGVRQPYQLEHSLCRISIATLAQGSHIFREPIFDLAYSFIFLWPWEVL